MLLLIDLLLASTTQEKPILCDEVTNISKNISHIPTMLNVCSAVIPKKKSLMVFIKPNKYFKLKNYDFLEICI